MTRAVVVLLCLVACARAADKPQTIDLWPGKPPGPIAATEKEQDLTKPSDGLIAGKRLIRLGHVATPTLTVYRPAKPNGVGVVICPGGAYNILAMDLEGTEVAEWLNTLGITAVVLKHRVPRPKTGAYHLPALMDAQRALSTVRSRATEWGMNPKQIGILGFSAGGHLAAAASTNFARRAYEPTDRIDEVSCRPDFTVLIYPAYLTDKSKEKLAEEIAVTKETPPAFLAHAGDDPIPADNSAQYYLALRRVGVPAELHIYPRGGHGYGLRRTSFPVTAWPTQCEAWFRDRGLLK
ncbi:MAG: alpha/beta hydrolase [Gemmataceae bacterium]